MPSDAWDPEWKSAGFQKFAIALIEQNMGEEISIDPLSIDAEDDSGVPIMLAGYFEPDSKIRLRLSFASPDIHREIIPLESYCN